MGKDNNLYYIDEKQIIGIGQPTLFFNGWVHADSYKIEVTDEKGNNIYTFDEKHGEYYREDVSNFFNENIDKNKYGFSKSILLNKKIKKVTATLIIDNQKISMISLSNSLFTRIMTKIKRIIKRYLNNIHIFFRALARLIVQFMRMPKALFNSSVRKMLNDEFKFDIKTKLLDIDNTNNYQKWIKKYEKFSKVEKLDYNPLISIAIPCYNPEEKFLKECIDSILNQTYQNFEICIADDCSPKSYVKDVLKKYEELDKRIKVIYREKNGNISQATNSAVSIASGEFIALVDNDDVLMPNALYEVVKTLNDHNGELDFIYSDEDKLDLTGKRCLPHFKGDWSPDTLLSINYITHFAVLRKSIMDEIGGFRTKCDGAQDYDMFLRFTEATTDDRIAHISKILYNWRMSETSTALSIDSKGYAAEAGRTALEDTLTRRGIKGSAHIYQFTSYYVKYDIDKNDYVSIIIPTRDKADILKKCIDSIYEHTSKDLFEIIIMDNGSVEVETGKYFKELTSTYDNVKIVKDDSKFNYSALNNEGVENASGNLILFLNNDIEVTTDGWLEEMMGFAKQEHIGAVGAKLSFPNNTIQHGGVVLGLGYLGVASHPFMGRKDDWGGYFSRLCVPYNYSAVTGACMMIEKDKFNQVKFDEKLSVSFNDVDLCLELLKNNYYNVMNPNVHLIHHESLSRGYDNTYAKKLLTAEETKYMKNKWNDLLSNDRFYNINYSLRFPFTLNTDKNRK